MVRKKDQQKIGIVGIITIVGLIAGAYYYYDEKAPQYNYSFEDRSRNSLRGVLADRSDRGFYEVPVYAINKGKSDGTIVITVSAVNATFTEQNGLGSFPSINFTKKAIVGDGWTGNNVYVKPNPGATQFTLSLSGKGQEPLSDYFGADPTQITYNEKFPNWWELQPY